MDYQFSPEDLAFREEVRTWLAENAPRERRPIGGKVMRDFDLAWQRRYAAFKEEFPRWDDAVVVVDMTSGAGGAKSAEEFIDALDARLRADGRFPAVDSGFPTSEAPAGLLLGEPIERVREVADQLRRAALRRNPPPSQRTASCADRWDSIPRASRASALR